MARGVCLYCTVWRGTRLCSTHMHHGEICCHNTDYVHTNGHDRTITVILAKHCIKLPDDGSLQSIHCHVQDSVIPCRSQEPLPFLPVIHFFLPLLSADHSSILPHFIQSSISCSTSWSCCFQIHIQYSFGNPVFFHSLYMSKPT